MKATEYECVKCGQVASSGRDTTWEDSGKSGIFYLYCRKPGHPRWPTDFKCPECGKMPREYWMWYRGDTDKKEYPLFGCCGEKWIPEEYDPNPFATETAI